MSSSPIIEWNEDGLFTEFSSFFSRSRLTIKVRVTQIYIYISDGIPEKISFESVDDSRRSSDLEIL